MAYTPHQRRMQRLAMQMTRGDTPLVRKALLEAMAVESNFKHINYGDRDSQGVLQQRPSQGWGPYRADARGAATDINEFLARARRNAKGFQGSPGQLAQSVQRSAFPGRYDERSGEVDAILKGLGGKLGPAINMGSSDTSPQTPVGSTNRMNLAQFVMQNNAAFMQGRGPFEAQAAMIGQLLSQGAERGLDGGEMAAEPPGTVKVKSASWQGAKKALVDAMRKAETMGLTIRENPMYDKVDPVHVKNSLHYSGRAADISGNSAQMGRFFKWAKNTYGKNINELIYDPIGSVFNGQYKSGAYGGHGSHVHIGF